MIKIDETIKPKKELIKNWGEIKLSVRRKISEIKEMKARGEWPPEPGEEKNFGELYPWNMEFCRVLHEDEFKESNWCEHCSIQDSCDRDKLRAAVNKRHAEEIMDST